MDRALHGFVGSVEAEVAALKAEPGRRRGLARAMSRASESKGGMQLFLRRAVMAGDPLARRRAPRSGPGRAAAPRAGASDQRVRVNAVCSCFYGGL
jgi:hypothetical protein